MNQTNQLRILVAITNYGSANDGYMAKLISAYRAMPFSIDIVVCTNIPKVIDGIEVVVGSPSKEPQSLPFAHKKLFAERIKDYDLFIYSEDDILMSEHNISAFLEVSRTLGEFEVAGFLRIENASGGDVYFPDMHNRFHWDPDSVLYRGQEIFAFFTNEHAGCYVLTRNQLTHAIRSGGYLLGPRTGKYEMLETAATDPYTQCGLKKVICISNMERFCVHHLSNKYVGKMGLKQSDVYRQTEALQQLQSNGKPTTPLFRTESAYGCIPWVTYYSKHYYEPVRKDVISLIPVNAKNVLSIGCGWGATEGFLVQKGLRVVALPLDSVIAACAESRGLQVVYGDFTSAREQLAREWFDCVLLSHVLHLVDNPDFVVSSFCELLRCGGSVVAVVPNRLRIAAIWNSLHAGLSLWDIWNYKRTGTQFACEPVVRKWFKKAGLATEGLLKIVPARAHALSVATLGLMDSALASELVIVARKL